jgi:hypothetical protein
METGCPRFPPARQLVFARRQSEPLTSTKDPEKIPLANLDRFEPGEVIHVAVESQLAASIDGV